MNSNLNSEKFKDTPTPFYYYDTPLLRQTLTVLQKEAGNYKNFVVHYAIKANSNTQILSTIAQAGLGADCVSGGEIRIALAAGFPANKIVFAGVGKSDWEINLALDTNILCFNVESLPELEVINELAARKNVTAQVCFRINPDVGAHTHANITTGLAENKFGIAMREMEQVVQRADKLSHISFLGLHFHIGSQILDMTDFVALCHRINLLQEKLEKINMTPRIINVGGGLGVSYDEPDQYPIPNFADYFATYAQHLQLRPNQELHFELGRAIVAQCGSLITRTLYVKQGTQKQFVIVDAGMTDLIRPALYHATHSIENISSTNTSIVAYDVVGPVCESSDVFAKEIHLPQCQRGDLLAIRSAGAYGEVMASEYNGRPLPKGYTEEQFHDAK